MLLGPHLLGLCILVASVLQLAQGQLPLVLLGPSLLELCILEALGLGMRRLSCRLGLC